YIDAAACQLDEVRRHPSDQVISLHFTPCTVGVSESSHISNHPHPRIVWRDVTDIEEAARFWLCYSIEEIVIRKIRTESTSTAIGHRRKMVLSGSPQTS